MSYFIVDEDGNSADLATNLGIENLMEKAGPLFTKFFDEGVVKAEDVDDLIAELEDTDEFDYIALAMADMNGDIMLSNGITEELDA